MMFQRKIDRAMNWLKEKNKKSDFDEYGDLSIEEDDYKLDKTDVLALIISALLVFGPILIILMFIVYLVL